ncbi:MAG: hypothetical protein GY872_16695 [Roseibacillus sp.]|nr:hypothetical protein [Roseibacillus sp.]
MQSRVKADLARQGLGDIDITGVDVSSDVDTHRRSIDGWVITVHLTQERSPLVYSMANQSNAPILLDGIAIPTPEAPN